MESFAFSKPPYYQELKGKRFSPFGKIKPLNSEKLKWPNRFSILAVLSWTLGFIAINFEKPLLFALGFLILLLFMLPSLYILLRRTSIALK